jgi:lipopolysaccharide transport system ATP-binding protein
MSTLAVRVENISKQYRIGALDKHATFREILVDAFTAPFRRGRLNLQGCNGHGPEAEDTIWALRDVSFEIKKGEIVGIIGRNGAGKSTLLKILSRITEPTLGFAEIHGRVGSLLEVGTGFHGELSGRENIYLNGAILGMRKAEIERKFDEIVAFAEVEKFIDTPVKRYSSGMYLRLAFAVAAHLEPEILIVDEVLAVGDASFQSKCIGKMGAVAKEGRTILFVSHNVAAVKSLCSRAILLDRGQVDSDGRVDEVVDRYVAANSDVLKSGAIPDDIERIGTGEAKLRSVQLANSSDKPVSELYFEQPFRVTLAFDVLIDIQDVLIEVNIGKPDGTDVVLSTTIDEGDRAADLTMGHYEVNADFDIVLLPGRYSIGLGIHHPDGMTIDFVRRVLDFRVLKVAQNGNGDYPWDTVRGYVRGFPRWQISKTGEDDAQRIKSHLPRFSAHRP